MRRAFALTLLLLGVVAAILLLGERARRAPVLAAQTAHQDAGPPTDPPSKTPRMVALRRMLPRYTLTLSAGEPRIEETVRRLAQQHGATLGGRDGDAWQLDVPQAQFKRFLRALRGDVDAGRGRRVGLIAAGEVAQRGEEARIEVSLRWTRP